MSSSASSSPVWVKTLFMLGSTASALAAGGLLFNTYMHIPGYIQNSSSANLLKQWQTMGAIGQMTVPPLALLAAGANFANAYLLRRGYDQMQQQSQSYRFLGAGVLSLAILPYTVVALGGTNMELKRREEVVGEEEEWKTTTMRGDGEERELRGTEVKDLIRSWGGLSAVRGFLLLASTVVGCDAMLQLTF